MSDKVTVFLLRVGSNISSMEDSVSSHFQTPRGDLKIRCPEEYFFFNKLGGVWKCGNALSHVFTLIYLLDQN